MKWIVDISFDAIFADKRLYLLLYKLKSSQKRKTVKKP